MVLEAVADGVLDALRERKEKLGIRISDCLAIANDARRSVAIKLRAVEATP